MKKLILILLPFFFFLSNVLATSTGSTNRNITIDGVITKGATNGTNGADWEADEEYLANDGVKFYLTWDNVNLYVAWKGGTSGHQRILWIDTDPKGVPTSGTGLDSLSPYGGVNAKLPFTANFFVNFESATVDRSYKFNAISSIWVKVSNNAFTRTISVDGSEYEAKIPWDSLGGRPSRMYFLSYINEKSGSGFVPGNTDGYIYGGAPTTVTSGDFDGNNFTMTIDAANTWFAATIASGVAPFSKQGALLRVDEHAGQTIPLTYSIEQNYPNPFNPTTNFQYSLAQEGLISLKIYDLVGHEIATLVNEVKQPGIYYATWNAAGLSSGIYFYKMQTKEFISTKKMILIK
ncbi:MAG: T9SS type A sorting domain-containing protein [Bacteroidota bacterium]